MIRRFVTKLLKAIIISVFGYVLLYPLHLRGIVYADCNIYYGGSCSSGGGMGGMDCIYDADCPGAWCNCNPVPTNTPKPAPTNTPVPPGTTPDPTTPPCANEENCACGDSYNGSCWVCNSCDNPTATPTPTPIPYTVAGYVKDAGSKNGVSGIRITVKDQYDNQEYVYTDANGYFESNGVVSPGEYYAVRRDYENSTAPGGREGPYTVDSNFDPTTSTDIGWTWIHPYGTTPGRDVKNGEGGYENQKAGQWDCSGPSNSDGSGPTNRCNFAFGANPKGHQDPPSCTAIVGWTCDPDEPSTDLKVHVYAHQPSGVDGNVFIGESTASNIRTDSGSTSQCGNDSTIGFELNIPDSLRTGQDIPIYVHGLNIKKGNPGNVILNDNPRNIACLQTPTISHTCTAGTTMATVSWTQVPGATSYSPRLDRNYDSHTCVDDAHNLCYDTTSNTASDRQFTFETGGDPIKVWVHAANPQVRWGPATSYTFTCPVPAAPTGLNRSCSTTSNEATFSWNAVSGISKYILRINKDPAGDWMGPGDQWKCVSGTSATRTIPQGEAYSDWSVQSSGGDANCKIPGTNTNVEYGKTIASGFTCPDTFPPPIPTSTVTCQYHSTNSSTGAKYYTATYSWDAVTDVGSAGLDVYPYWSQASYATSFSPILTSWYNSWTDARTRTTGLLGESTPVYFHVRSRDANNNQSAWSTTQSIVPNDTNCNVPTPTPTPTHTPTPTPTTSTCIPAAEICDGLDNDCDNTIDEGGVCTTPPPTPACPPAATATCGTYDPVSDTTSVNVTWPGGENLGLQIMDDTGYWWYNDYASSPFTLSSKDNAGAVLAVPPDRTIYPNTTYDFLSCLTGGNEVICPRPTATPTLPNTPTPTFSPTPEPNNDICDVRNISCPAEVESNTSFSISFQFQGTGPNNYQYESRSIYEGGTQRSICKFSDETAFDWHDESFNLTSPYSPGTYTYQARCYGGYGSQCGSADRLQSCSINVIQPSWLKLSDASFHKRGALNNAIPNPPVLFDSDDTVDPYMVINNAGLVSAESAINLLPGTASLPNNVKGNYVPVSSQIVDISSYIEYARHRKKVKIISNLSEVESDTINIVSDDISINAVTDLAGIQNAVIIAEGEININDFPETVDIFNPSARSIALMATESIKIHSSFSEINGIFIAPIIDFASDVSSGGEIESPLKINGNVISTQEPIEMKRTRPASDREKPSVFVVFKPKMYLDLLMSLSTIIREGRQLQ